MIMDFQYMTLSTLITLKFDDDYYYDRLEYDYEEDDGTFSDGYSSG